MLLIILLKLLPTPIDTIYIKGYESSEKVFGNDVQYELGINGHYYPATKLGYGPYLKVKYTFDIWRKR